MQDNFFRQLQDQPLAAVADYYARRLAASPKAIAYLHRNALHCELMAIGFSDRTLGKHIPSKILKLGRNIRIQLEQLGIYRPSGHEHFRGMLTLPLHSTSGQITGLYGRRIDRHVSGPAEQTIGWGIFNADAMNQFEELIITDSVLDAWTLYAAGHSNTIFAIDYQLQIAELSKVKRVLLCGESIDCEPFSDCQVHRIALPDGTTLNGYAIERQDEVDPLAKLIRVPPGTWFLLGEGKVILPVNDSARRWIGKRQARSHPTSSNRRFRRHPPSMQDLDIQSTDSETSITIETRRWRIRGLDRNHLPGILKVNVLVFN